MKRVTILVDDIGETDGDGERLLFGVRSPVIAGDVWVAADRIISIEDHVEPLPTEPGARFWGRLGDDAPTWWFVREISEACRYYLPVRGIGVHPDEAETRGLVRLPDPKLTDGDAR